MNRMLQKAFTLIEVNLAIFIMAGGVLAMISLYSLGFRESRQSREDVASAALAEDVLNRLAIALSSTKLTWKQWVELPFSDVTAAEDGRVKGDADAGRPQTIPDNGWLSYVNVNNNSYTVRNLDGPSAYSELMAKLDPEGPNANDGNEKKFYNQVKGQPTLPSGMAYALVASRHDKYSPVITLAVRCVRKNLRNTLMSQPVFSTEVHFQGGF